MEMTILNTRTNEKIDKEIKAEKETLKEQDKQAKKERQLLMNQFEAGEIFEVRGFLKNLIGDGYIKGDDYIDLDNPINSMTFIPKTT